MNASRNFHFLFDLLILGYLLLLNILSWENISFIHNILSWKNKQYPPSGLWNNRSSHYIYNFVVFNGRVTTTLHCNIEISSFPVTVLCNFNVIHLFGWHASKAVFLIIHGVHCSYFMMLHNAYELELNFFWE